MVVVDMVGDRKIDQKYCDVKKAKAGKQKKLRNNPKNETAQGVGASMGEKSL